FFAGKQILEFIFGPNYGSAWLVLVILSIGKLANSLTGSCGYLLLMTGHQKYALYSVLIVGSITLMSAILTVDAYGVVAVACCFSLGMFVQQMSLYVKARRELAISTFASFYDFMKLVKGRV